MAIYGNLKTSQPLRWESQTAVRTDEESAPNQSRTAFRRSKMVAFRRVVVVVAVLIFASIPTIFSADKDNAWLVDEVCLFPPACPETAFGLFCSLI